MKNGSELYQIVYSLLAAQIEFGTYRFGDPLPKMEETARWLSVSLDTVRAAYLQLKQKRRPNRHKAGQRARFLLLERL